jgi:hypothetical protein
MKDELPRPRPPVTDGKAPAKAARLAREAAALRANLRKRKDQARAQAAGKPLSRPSD